MENGAPGKETFSKPGPRRLIMHTVIIGAGWAGLAAAVKLCKHHPHRVTLLESARQAGGRARSAPFNKIQVDNGQHLLIGAYHKTLQLLELINLEETAAFERLPLQLIMRNANNQEHRDVHMQVAALPAPLHMLLALSTASGLTLAERWQALRLCAALPRLKLNKFSDINVSTLLQGHRQSARLVNELWEPLCLAIMNTPVATASASVFVRVLIDAFTHQHRDSDLLIPRRNLGAVIPEPAIDTIHKLGGEVRLGCKVKSLEIIDKQIKSAILNDGTIIEADQFILATAAPACQRLLKGHKLFERTVEQLSRLDTAPICTVYLQYPEHVSLDIPMIGLTGTIGQWLFDRRICGQPGLMAIVISGHGEHECLDNMTLAEKISVELATLHPHWPEPEQSLVIREKRATFVCHNNVHAHRPGYQTDAANAWLAGDYTDTGYPATLEGAVRSGFNCAEKIITP